MELFYAIMSLFMLVLLLIVLVFLALLYKRDFAKTVHMEDPEPKMQTRDLPERDLTKLVEDFYKQYDEKVPHDKNQMSALGLNELVQKEVAAYLGEEERKSVQ